MNVHDMAAEAHAYYESLSAAGKSDLLAVAGLPRERIVALRKAAIAMRNDDAIRLVNVAFFYHCVGAAYDQLSGEK